MSVKRLDRKRIRIGTPEPGIDGSSATLAALVREAEALGLPVDAVADRIAAMFAPRIHREGAAPFLAWLASRLGNSDYTYAIIVALRKTLPP